MFEKSLSANDVGVTGSHQAGVLVPKSNGDLLNFFPRLEPSVLNPSVVLEMKDEAERKWHFRYVYYNNKLHSDTGTRNEYRLTRLSSYLSSCAARPGDVLRFTRESEFGYRVACVTSGVGGAPPTVRLRGWRRVY